MRKAIFGKLSVWCFVALWVLYFLLFLLDAPRRSSGGCPGGSILMLMVFITPLCVLSGIVFGIVGAIRKESPKWWYIAGLLLNLSLPAIWLVMVME